MFANGGVVSPLRSPGESTGWYVEARGSRAGERRRYGVQSCDQLLVMGCRLACVAGRATVFVAQVGAAREPS